MPGIDGFDTAAIGLARREGKVAVTARSGVPDDERRPRAPLAHGGVAGGTPPYDALRGRARAVGPVKASRRRRRPRRASVLRAAVLASLLAVTPATSSAQPTQAELQVLGLIGPVPTHWQPRPPASGMRLAEALVPPDAHFVVYYFGPGQGGTPALNIARWRSQFTVPGGGPVEPRIERFRGEGPPVTVVELRGDYARGIGTGDGNPRLPDHILRAGIVEAPRGSLFVHLYGPAATVARERGAFDRFLRNLRAAP